MHINIQVFIKIETQLTDCWTLSTLLTKDLGSNAMTYAKSTYATSYASVIYPTG